MTIERTSYFKRFSSFSSLTVGGTRVIQRITWRYLEPMLALIHPVEAHSCVICVNYISLLRFSIARAQYSSLGAESIEAQRHLKKEAILKLRSSGFWMPILALSRSLSNMLIEELFYCARYRSVSVITYPDPSSSCLKSMRIACSRFSVGFSCISPA